MRNTIYWLLPQRPSKATVNATYWRRHTARRVYPICQPHAHYLSADTLMLIIRDVQTLMARRRRKAR